MDKNIVNSLILCKQNFDKDFEDFAFKQDFEAVFKHEYDHYVHPLCENIVPLLYKNLKENPDLKITVYYPYIMPKYHDIVKKEVADYEKNSLNMVKNIGKGVKDTFLVDLMEYSKKTEEEQMFFITNFFKNSSHLFSTLIKSDPLYALTICAEMRNPKIQTLIISNFNKIFKDFIETKNKIDFDKDILPLFVYPIDVTVEEYYKKWIAKEAIHVKFSKDILGQHYEYAKQTLKHNEKLKRRNKNH